MNFTVIDQGLSLISGQPADELNALARETGEFLKEHGFKVSFAESCTGGLVAKTFTDVPGSSEFFEYGMVTYSDRVKEELLGVAKDTIDRYSVVSAQVAAEMAYRIKTVSNSEIGIGITGVAGPGPDGDHPEGEIYIGIADRENCAVLKLMTKTKNARDFNRNLAALNAINLIYLDLKNKLFEG